MGSFREIKPIFDENLFEAEPHIPEAREVTHRRRSTPALPSLSFALPEIPAFKGVNLKAIFWICFALALVWFGAATTGTFYGPASGKFSGIFATIFYQYQLGTMLEFLGFYIFLDSIKKLF